MRPPLVLEIVVCTDPPGLLIGILKVLQSSHSNNVHQCALVVLEHYSISIFPIVKCHLLTSCTIIDGVRHSTPSRGVGRTLSLACEPTQFTGVRVAVAMHKQLTGAI